MLRNHLIVCRLLLLLPSNFPGIGIFSNELALPIRRPKYWSFSISPSNEYSGLISFRIEWFDLLAVQWTLKSLLQHHSLKASIFCHSAFFIVQLGLNISRPFLPFPEVIFIQLSSAELVGIETFNVFTLASALIFSLLCYLS